MLVHACASLPMCTLCENAKRRGWPDMHYLTRGRGRTLTKTGLANAVQALLAVTISCLPPLTAPTPGTPIHLSFLAHNP